MRILPIRHIRLGPAGRHVLVLDGLGARRRRRLARNGLRNTTEKVLDAGSRALLLGRLQLFLPCGRHRLLRLLPQLDLALELKRLHVRLLYLSLQQGILNLDHNELLVVLLNLELALGEAGLTLAQALIQIGLFQLQLREMYSSERGRPGGSLFELRNITLLFANSHDRSVDMLQASKLVVVLEIEWLRLAIAHCAAVCGPRAGDLEQGRLPLTFLLIIILFYELGIFLVFFLRLLTT